MERAEIYDIKIIYGIRRQAVIMGLRIGYARIPGTWVIMCRQANVLLAGMQA